jgi:hypothetical protein
MPGCSAGGIVHLPREIPPPLPPPGPTSWTRSCPARSLNHQKEQRDGVGPSCSSPGVRPGIAWIMPGNCRTAHPDLDTGCRSCLGLTGLSRDLLFDQMRRGNLPYVKTGRRRLITRQHLEQFLGVAS